MVDNHEQTSSEAPQPPSPTSIPPSTIFTFPKSHPESVSTPNIPCYPHILSSPLLPAFQPSTRVLASPSCEGCIPAPPRDPASTWFARYSGHLCRMTTVTPTKRVMTGGNLHSSHGPWRTWGYFDRYYPYLLWKQSTSSIEKKKTIQDEAKSMLSVTLNVSMPMEPPPVAVGSSSSVVLLDDENPVVDALGIAPLSPAQRPMQTGRDGKMGKKRSGRSGRKRLGGRRRVAMRD